MVHHMFAFVMGLWLALLQSCYFFLLEARLTSRASSFFVALFFWLAGFLVGLNLRSHRALPWLIGAAPAAYYAALIVLGQMPYRLSLLPLVGVCIAIAGALAGSYFPYAGRSRQPLKLLLLHENNGFIVGLILALVGSVFHGRLLLDWVPVVGIPFVVVALVASQRSSGPGASSTSETN